MATELERWQIIDKNFTDRVSCQDLPEIVIDDSQLITKTDFVQLFTAQLTSRHIDLQARILKQKNLGFYTIASSGHENNIALSYVLNLSDIALLHYRSSAFMLNRAYKHSNQSGLDKQIIEQLKSLVAAKSDQISNGRHKVFGSVELNVPPQTSTIASHLPKAVGLALSINQNKILKNKAAVLKNNSVVLCSFGDASFNHSTAQGAINAAKILSYQNIPLPIIFVCEDNNIGISVPTPSGWIASNFDIKNNKNIYYIDADGLNLLDVISKAKEAEAIARIHKKPVFLHIKTVRLIGHAGSDIEQHYLTDQEIMANEARDPLLYSARLAIELNYLSNIEILEIYETIRVKVTQMCTKILNEPKLGSAREVMASIIPCLPKEKSPRIASEKLTKTIFDKIMPTWQTPRNMAQALNLAFAQTLAQYDNTVFLGEDVGKKGGVYRVTANLQKYFGRKRIFDSILDEQTILGTGQGFAQNGLLPILEIQFLAYLHNAIDQLRGEAATLSFFSSGKLANPMIIRLPGLAYQKGFGGHFHNDNSITALRDIPGIIIACPSNSHDAVRMWRSVVKAAYTEFRICVFLEPIALYFIKDLYKPDDNLMLSNFPSHDDKLAIGEIGVKKINFTEDQYKPNNQGNKKNKNIIILTYANGHFMAQKAMYSLINKFNIGQRVDDITLVDIRWLKPLPLEEITNYITQAKSESTYILIVDECRETGSVSEELICKLYDFLAIKNLLSTIKIKRITAYDSFIPLGPAADHVLPSVNNIIDNILNNLELL